MHTNHVHLEAEISEGKQAEERCRLVVEATLWSIRKPKRLFGYNRRDFLGQRIAMLVPERFRGTHGDLRFFSAPEARAMGSRRDLYGLRKNGTEVPIEIGLNPISGTEGDFVLTSIIRITERKRAEDGVAAAKLEVESRNKGLETNDKVRDFDITERKASEPTAQLDGKLEIAGPPGVSFTVNFGRKTVM